MTSCVARALIVAPVLLLAIATSASAFELRSSAFPAGADIATPYTCDGKDVSPPLRWSGPPPGTKSFVLIADDPDAPGGTWVHWVLYSIPATAAELPEGVPTKEMVASVGNQGVNDFRKIGYGGPCPPPGPAHRYVFRLYAVDMSEPVAPGRTKAEVLAAIKGHVLAQAELMGRYRRR